MFEYDEEIRVLGADRILRIDGYLAEILFCIWLRTNFKERDIYRAEIRNIEEDGFRDYRNNLSGKIIHLARRSRMVLSIARYIRFVFLYMFRWKPKQPA